MKVLFDHPYPFLLWHGGLQIQIEQTKAALEKLGVEVENVRWWDDSQHGDIIHYFGRPLDVYVQTAQGKNMKVVVGELFSGVARRPVLVRKVQRGVMTLASRILPAELMFRLAWNSMRLADACVTLTAWEGQIASEMFQIDPRRIHVVPNGVELPFFEAPPGPRGPWLVCTTTITARKRVLELAQAAVQAKSPLWIVGRPYNAADPYGKEFLQLAKTNPSVLRYEGPINDRRKLAAIYRSARGFVLLSSMESLSLSALEAAACECPLLLSDMPWARTVFQEHASYCPVPASVKRTAEHLKGFYDRAPTLPTPPKPLTWLEVAKVLKSVYERVLAN